MRKIVLALALSIGLSHSISAQSNLVMNGRFEEQWYPDTCIVSAFAVFDFGVYHDIHQLKYWWTPIAYQSYYVCSCDTDSTILATHHPAYGVPHNEFGGAPDPNGGRAYVAQISWDDAYTLTTFSNIETHLV
jgi:hypothetical protein